jgi:poly(3-hydroxyalkanoate) depolymerase
MSTAVNDTRTVRVGGQRLRVSIQGSGRPLLLCNGIGATADLFEPFRNALDAVGGWQTVAFDAPGVGGSPAPLYPPTLRSLAGTVAGLIDELGYEQVDLLGLSWGGALAQETAYRFPGRVRRLVLVATMHGWTSQPGRPAAVGILASPARYYSPAFLRAVAPTLYGREILDHPDLLARHAQLRATRPPSPVGYLWQLWALRRWTSLPWLGRVSQPTLVLAGDDDPIIPLANARTIARHIPGGRLHVVAGGGHLFLYLRAAAMAETISEFLGDDR